jgi:hypothetical protein
MVDSRRRPGAPLVSRPGDAVRQAQRRLGPHAGLERGGLLRPRVHEREGSRAERHHRTVRLRESPRRAESPRKRSTAMSATSLPT